MHDPSAMEGEKSLIEVAIAAESQSRFVKKIDQITAAKQVSENQILMCKSFLTTLSKDYQHEINQLKKRRHDVSVEKNRTYQEIAAIKPQLEQAYSDKKDAYADLQDAKDDVDSWYAKSQRSPRFLGNRGKELPIHAFFGQSHGDLASSKDDRDTAYAYVDSCKEDIAELKAEKERLGELIASQKSEIKTLSEDINKLVADRESMSKLKAQGHTPQKLRNEINGLSLNIHQLQTEILILKNRCLEFVECDKHRRGFVSLQASIADLLKKKEAFIKDFDSLENQNKRTREHREIWMRDHA